MKSLYNSTEIYNLFDTEAKYQNVKKHWEKLLEGKDIHSFLDVSYGTGSLTLPLAELGVSLYGSDLTPDMLASGEKKAQKKGLPVQLRQCDFWKLTEHFTETFDCVGSTGNSLPYVSNEEIPHVLEQMDSLIKKGGYLYYDMRNWEKILSQRNRFYLYDPVFVDDVRVNLVQVWDYHPDDTMTFHLLYTFERNGKVFQKEHFEEHYYPVKRNLLLNKLKEMGYTDIQIRCHPAQFNKIDPQQADWYCVIAKKDPDNF